MEIRIPAVSSWRATICTRSRRYDRVTPGRLICIDPPYNTGNEGWVYNDNVNAPKISAG